MKDTDDRPSVEALSAELASALAGRRRYLLGVTGIPGSGKSTFANALVGAVDGRLGSGRSVVVPMDGFHYPNAVLETRGLVGLKGSPATFDAAGFASLLKKIRESWGQEVLAPAYDRLVHEPVANAIRIGPEVQLIVAEGNYLLLEEGPWRNVRAMLDAVWYLDVPVSEAMARVRARHLRGGRGERSADEHIARNDLPNARVIESTRERADRIIVWASSAGDN